MEKILTLGKDETNFVIALGFEFIKLPRFTTDEDRHDFVTNTLKSREFDKLIILIDGDDGYDSLRLGLHIRLTIDLHQKHLVPILYVSPDTLAVILRDAGAWGRILTTKGCKLAKPDVQAVQAGIDFPPLSPAEVGPFLALIQLRPDETVGRHSLANQWGAYALDKAASTQALKNSPVLAKAQKQLYFKYVEAINYKWGKPDRSTNTANDSKLKYEPIDAIGKKILLIDDEAEKGWSDVLRELFRKSNSESEFQILNRKVDGWKSLDDEEKKLILDTGFDLFLIDLRLTGSEEEDIAKPEDFSGTDVMRHIKQHNAGNQVIMFTASNKAWNLKALLDIGADGYYIKESPEYNFPESFSEENLNVFIREVKSSLSKGYLRDVFTKVENLKNQLRNKMKRHLINKELLIEISRYLDFSFNCLKNHKVDSDAEMTFSMAYTFLFLIVEALSKQLIIHDEPVLTGDTYKFQFRKDGSFLKQFDGVGRNTKRDLEVKTTNHQYIPSISYKQQICNLFYFAGLSSDKIVSVVDKRNAFQHPNLIKNDKFAIVSQQDVIDVFEIVYALTLKL